MIIVEHRFSHAAAQILGQTVHGKLYTQIRQLLKKQSYQFCKSHENFVLM